MRLGLLGGTFDPVHFGHLLLAEQCREQCALDEVWFVPAGMPPHKRQAPVSSGADRAEMLELATAGLPQFQISRIELERAGASFTVETLAELHDQDATRELFFLIGADSLADLPHWREPQRIGSLAWIVAVNRGDRPLPAGDSLREQVGEPLASRVKLVTMPGIDIAASDIRRRAEQGKSIRFMTPRSVEIYIHEHRLYRPDR